MNFLNHLSLRNKLIIASAIPLLAFLYYLQIILREEAKKKSHTREILASVAEVEEISKVLHEFQKERTLTLSFIASGGLENRQELSGQREITGKALFALQTELKQQKGNIPGYALADNMDQVREKADKLRPTAEVDSFYTNIKTNLLDEIAMILRSFKGIAIKNHLEEHLYLLYAKEFLAQIRSELGSTFASRKFHETSYGSFAALKGKYEQNIQRFKKIASPELKDYFLKKYQGPSVQHTHTIIENTFNDPTLANVRYNLDSWWSNATNSINILKEVEDVSSAIIKQRAEEEMAAANANLIRNVTIGILAILLILLIVASTIYSIVNAINRIKSAAERMAKGDIDIVLDIKSKDEIGALANSFNQMISETRKFSEIADDIGKGDYSPMVKIRSEADKLGIALDRMKLNLQKLTEENQIRTWLLKGSGDLNDKIRGEKDVHVLAQDAIIQLTTYLKAQIGAIYLNEGNRLVLVGSYAFNRRKSNSNSFKFGQGLVGQAALEKKTILFREVPEDYIRINSGLGNSIPKSILIFPFLYDDEVKGVIEIGAAHEFSDLDIQMLEMIGENVAIAFHSAQSRSTMRDLLEETQRQAEELEVQQEELKQSNEELQEKTDLLERSETELKAQHEELQQTNEELEEKANLLEDQKLRLEDSKLDIESKARELEVTSKYKSEFLANMSHELRTPLNSILILSQLLSENKAKTLTGKEIEFARNIYNSGADLLSLINEILDLSKVESGQMALDISEVGFAEIEDDMKAMFSEVARNNSIDFTIDMENNLSTLTTDKQRLEQILRNFLSNAFKFTGNGGKVSLSIAKANAKTIFNNRELQNISDIIAFKVSDTGIGIRSDKQGIIFEAFQQADGSTRRKYGGTGLGLSISRELAIALAGEIQVESIEGQGSSFTLFIPMYFDSSRRVINERTEIEIGQQRQPSPENKIIKYPVAVGEVKDDRNDIRENDKVILIMEDDIEFAKMLLEFVTERNYKGIVAIQGNTGLSYARLYKPDAIFLDMKLPVMDGAEVLKQLKNDPELRHIPVQIISGYNMRKEVFELGAFDFIQKPVTKDQLIETFERIGNFVNKKLKRLLIVEDNKTHNKAIRELIGNGDVKSFSAYSGEEAHTMMHKDRYDCVIVDLGLPDMSGFDLLEKIKLDKELNTVPIIVYTGKDLSKEENAKLMRVANTVVLKTANSHERLLDETMLFLHRVESKLPKEKQNIIRNLHKTNEVLQNKKILVVDDDIRNIYSLTNALEEEGMNCLTAENGYAALEMLNKHSDIDIVLMDIMMPQMDGYQATKEIRKKHKFSKLPIIALTAKAMKGDREKCLEAGMSDYISKPVNIEQLLSLMRVWLYR